MERTRRQLVHLLSRRNGAVTVLSPDPQTAMGPDTYGNGTHVWWCLTEMSGDSLVTVRPSEVTCPRCKELCDRHTLDAGGP